MINITILGSTGSIGKTTLSIIKKNPKKYKIIALTAKKNIKVLIEQCLIFNPDFAVVHNKQQEKNINNILKKYNSKTKILSGHKSICEIASLNDADQIVSAISGIAGLLPTISAIQAGKKILLANKELLVSSGKIFFKYVKKYKAQIIPIDSEHSAIFQLLPNEAKKKLGFCNIKKYGIKKILLTGSGGPFLKTPINKFKHITPKLACKHPNWAMGKKISVDSATMMNKGFEYIEARLFFNISNEEIDIIIHPESIIHSMIYYIDGNIIAQLSAPDMSIPISYAIEYPKRNKSPTKYLNFKKIKTINFISPDFKRYPCLKIAIDAYNNGQSYATILNAANEISVKYFLKRKIKFNDIAKINLTILEKFTAKNPTNIDDVLEIDKETRNITKHYIKSLNTTNYT